jgi:23S rRNA (cytidine2498-2'-O)-methyltransferase
MHILLCDRGTERFLIQELHRAFRDSGDRVLAPGLVGTEFVLQPGVAPLLVFSRQFLPDAEPRRAESIKQWADQLLAAIQTLPEHQPWQCHVFARYGAAGAGQNRCRLIRDALGDLLQRKRRHMLKCWENTPAPFTPAHSIVQLLLTSPDSGFLSIAGAPLPFALRAVLWPFPEGEIAVASDKAAPSRAFAKLLEAEQRLGAAIGPGERCVDLGASPGSWSYVALERGARVIAVDRAPLRADLMANPRLAFRSGDAFKYEPERQVDWLLCDVIAAPERSIELLLRWVRSRWPRRFVVTIKFKGEDEYGALEQVKHALPPLCADFRLIRLCANKNEACAFGEMSRPLSERH